jgi:hypothetical protein
VDAPFPPLVRAEHAPYRKQAAVLFLAVARANSAKNHLNGWVFANLDIDPISFVDFADYHI